MISHPSPHSISIPQWSDFNIGLALGIPIGFVIIIGLALAGIITF